MHRECFLKNIFYDKKNKKKTKKQNKKKNNKQTSKNKNVKPLKQFGPIKKQPSSWYRAYKTVIYQIAPTLLLMTLINF